MDMTFFLQNYKSKVATTHSCMNGSFGGKFDVPFESLSEFHSECMEAFQSGSSMYLSERIPTTGPFKFFVDLDFDEDTNSSIPARDGLLSSIITTVYNTCVKDIPDQSIVSFRGDYKIHINFPNVIVNKKSVESIYAALLIVVKTTYPLLESTKTENPWKVVLDSSVYNSGLRTLVSRKKRSFSQNYYKIHELINGEWFSKETTLEDLHITSIFSDQSLPITKLKTKLKDLQKEEKITKVAKPIVTSCSTDILNLMYKFHNETYDFRKPFLKNPIVSLESHSVSFPLVDRYCYFQKREHKSNNCYIILDYRGSRFRCHDEFCKGKDEKVTAMEFLPEGIQNFWKVTFENVMSIDDELKTSATKDCRDNIKYFYPKSSDALTIREMKNMFVSDQDQDFGFCQNCKEYSNVFETYQSGWCLRCTLCNETTPPKNSLVPILPIYGSLKQYFMKINFTLVNNNNTTTTTTIVNNYNNDHYTGAWDKEVIQIFQDDKINDCFKFSLSGNDNSLAKLLVKLYGEKFHGSVIPTERWFIFEGHSWVEGVDAYYALKKQLSDPEFLGYFKQAILHYQSQNTQDEQTKKKIKHLEGLLENLQSNAVRTTILKDAIGEFYFTRPKFVEKLNTKNYMAFANGIYDFDNMIFRDGTPDDCFSMKSPCTYIPFEETDKKVIDVMKFLKDIIPDPLVLTYLLKILGLCLTTDTSQQYFFILTGSGSNGKSKIMTLLENCLGDYHGTASPELITAKREKANQANESLASLEKSRVLIMSEAAKSDIIQSSLLKMFTGEDTISTRKNYGSQLKFKPKFKLLFICNDIPKVSENGLAVWRRIKIINFPSRFVDVPNPEMRNEKPKNEKFTKYILEECQNAFISILVEYHRLYKQDGLVEPSSVSLSTAQYKTENVNPIPLDVFENEMIERHEGSGVKSVDLQAKLKAWAINNLEVVPKPSVLKEEMIRYFKCDPAVYRIANSERIHGWKNYRFISNE